MEETKYSEIIKGYTFEQLVYERAILLKQYANIKKQLAQYDEECKRRLNSKCLGT